MEKKKIKLLIVDDNTDILDDFKDCLESFGYDVSLAQDGLIAQRKLRETKFDVLITDIVMPNLSGIGLVTWIRNDKEGINSKIPILLIGGYRDTHEMVADLIDKTTKHLCKPFDIFKMEKLVNELYRSSL